MRAEDPAAGATSGRDRATRREATAVAFLLLAALAVRWPELINVPRFTDETREVMLGLQIARGEVHPLTNATPHIGSLFNYMIAVAYLMVGPRFEIGRELVMVFGALTVVPTYLLGRSIAGPRCGLLAAALLGASAAHIAVISHVAYAHMLTPLFSTAGLWLLHRAVAERSGPHLAACGLVFGIAFQTHPSASALWPGAAAYLFWQGRALLNRWLALAGALALLVNLNLVVFNIISGFYGVTEAVARSGRYLEDSPLTPDGWAIRLLVLLRAGAVSLGGLVSETILPEALFNPSVTAYTALALYGLVLLGRRGQWLPAMALLSGALVLSFLSIRFEPIAVRGRNIALLLPLGYITIAVAVLALRRRLVRSMRPPWVANLASLAAILALLAGPLLLLYDYYAEAQRDGRTNQDLLAALEAVSRSGHLEQPVYVDEQLILVRTHSGGKLLEQLRMAFEMRGQQYALINVEDRSMSIDPPPGVSFRLVLRQDSVDLAASRYQLEPLGEAERRARLRVFRASTGPPAARRP